MTDTNRNSAASVPGVKDDSLAPAESREAGICFNCGSKDTVPYPVLVSLDVAAMFKDARVCNVCKHVTIGESRKLPNLSQLKKAP